MWAQVSACSLDTSPLKFIISNCLKNLTLRGHKPSGNKMQMYLKWVGRKKAGGKFFHYRLLDTVPAKQHMLSSFFIFSFAVMKWYKILDGKLLERDRLLRKAGLMYEITSSTQEGWSSPQHTFVTYQANSLT